MKHCLPAVIFRASLGLLLLAALGGCSLYRKVHHPYRLPTPKPSPEYLAQQKEKKAAEKLRSDNAKEASASAKKKKSDESTEEAATDVSMPANNGATASTGGASEAKSGSIYPERSTVKYDKHELMKKSKLMRRRVHKNTHKPYYHRLLHPLESIRDFFKYGLHAKPNYSIDHRPAPKAAPDTEPKDAPEAAPSGKP